MSRYRELFEAELAANDIEWCRGGCGIEASHRRGFVPVGTRVVHFDAEVTTRKTLMTALHEIGHVVLDHDHRRKRRWEREVEATAYAINRMRALGVPVPREKYDRYVEYIARMKQWGDASIAGRRTKGAAD